RAVRNIGYAGRRSNAGRPTNHPDITFLLALAAMNTDHPRLIEVAFPLKQASLDSVHEKNVRHGHISTLHIWPARRQWAACGAGLIATLRPDPGTPEKRKELLEKIGGKVITEVQKKKVE